MAKEPTEQEKKLADDINQMFQDAMIAKETFAANWMEYLNAWNNSLYSESTGPAYRSNHVSNFIFSTIESMRPIIFDSNPKFEALPVDETAAEYSRAINTALDYEWDRSAMQNMLISNYIYTLVIGTSCIMLTWNPDVLSGNPDGEVVPVPVSPFNLFPDPLATNVDDAEYICYANYFHQKKLAQMYPEWQELLLKGGASIEYSELVNDRNENSNIDNQILVLEMWMRDWTEVESEDEDGNKTSSPKFPKGRVVTCAPELGIIFEDKPNPYDTGRFPFFLFKNIDVPFQFWGEGEVKWLLSPQKSINELTNQIIDNAKHTANAQWIIDSNAGIPEGTLTNRPGQIVRKRPGTSVERATPPSMPQYVNIAIETFKRDIEVISGVHDITRGQTPTGIESGSAIQLLQDSAQTRIRLKVNLLECVLSVMGNEWLARLKQFWKEDRLIPVKTAKSRVTGIPQQQMQQAQMIQNPMMPAMNAQADNQEQDSKMYDFIKISKEGDGALTHDYRIKVIGVVGSNINRATLLNLMLDLIRTPAEDGLPVVTREAVLEFVPEVNRDLIIKYLNEYKQEQELKRQQEMMQNELMTQLQQLGGQVNEIGQVTGGLSQRAQKEDDEKNRELMQAQGYQMGMNDVMAFNNQLGKSGNIPPELMEQLAGLSDEELAAVLAAEPELASMIG